MCDECNIAGGNTPSYAVYACMSCGVETGCPKHDNIVVHIRKDCEVCSGSGGRLCSHRLKKEHYYCTHGNIDYVIEVPHGEL